MTRAIPLSLGVLLVALAGGCAMGPNYQRPPVPTPESYRFASAVIAPAEAQRLADAGWWRVYRDPGLQKLIGTALLENLDLRIATWRVEEARASANASRWALTPGLSANINAQRAKNSAPVPGAQSAYNAFSVFGAFDWELDVWGRLRRNEEASFAQFFSTEENRRWVLNLLVADVAQTWFTLRGLDLQRQIALQTIETRQRTLALFRSRLRAGIGAEPEVANGEALLAQAQAQEAALSLRIAQLENQLSILLGRPPAAVARPAPSPAMELEVPEIPPGVPSSLLERRSDVRAAEQQLVAANAGIGIAEANLFPQISLTAALGLLSPQLSAILNGEPESWRYGGNVSWLAPILAHHALLDARDAAEARYQEALAAYVRTVLGAMREVSDALVAEQQLRLQIGFLEKQVAGFQKQRDLAEARFKAGVASFLEITTVDEFLFPAELALAQARTQRALAQVALYRALGGGWESGSLLPEPAR